MSHAHLQIYFLKVAIFNKKHDKRDIPSQITRNLFSHAC